MPVATGYLCRRISSSQAVIQPAPEQPVQGICVQGQLLLPRPCSNAGGLRLPRLAQLGGRAGAWVLGLVVQVPTYMSAHARPVRRAF